MGKTTELLSLLKTGNSDAARRLIVKFKKGGKKKALAKELNLPDDNGQTVIHFCAAQNFVEFLQDLAELGASIDLADNKGYTPLHLAAASGRTSAVTALIGMGADPNISSRTGDTALHLACHGGHATSVEALVMENANCTMLNVSGYTPLDLACQSGHTQVVSLLLRSGQFSAAYLQRSDMPHTSLVLAAKQGHNECIALLVKHGFDVNRKLPGGNGGTALHEAALHGKVDTVRYLIQCGVDVQKTNTQGHTALDIVNMYVDPRTAGLMKQVLQDALAQLARSRIAQQHATGQASMSSVRPQPSQQQPSGFSYFPSSGQPVRQMSEEHRQYPVAGQRQISQPSSGYPHHLRGQPAGHPVQFNPQVSGHHATGHPHQTTGQPRQATEHHHQTAGQPRQATAHPHQTSGNPHQTAGHPRHETGHPHQTTGQPRQATEHHHQTAGQPRQATAHPHQTSGNPHQTAGHPRHETGHFHQATGHPRHETGRPYQTTGHSQTPRQPMNQNHSYTAHSAQPLPAQAYQPRVAQENSGLAQPSAPQNVQHIYPKPGTPEAVRKAPGMGGDLAAIIAAKAASRKPIVSSPTRKESGELMDEHFTRSATVSGEPSVQQARTSAQYRRSSMSDRSSASPERGDSVNPPTLPRRVQAGPPPFKPVPPPEEPRGQVGAGGELESGKRRVFSSDLERPQPPKPQPSPAPSEESELMAKLKRRQNKIIEAEQVAPEPVAEEPREEEVVQQPKPPPPPQRKTPTLNSAPQPSPAQEQAPQEPVVAVKQKTKPPPPKPKDVEPEMSPWQQEIAARRARMADHERESELEQGATNNIQSEEKPSDLIPKPAPKLKRNKVPPPAVKSAVPAREPAQPTPDPPQDPPPPGAAAAAPWPPVIPMRGESVVVVVEEAPAPPPEVSSTLAADQLSRSTSLSSLTAGTGSPQLPCVEHMPVLDWLTSYKLGDYVPVFEGNGYETTELMVGITQEELQEMGINKIGHRKKLMSALASWPQRDHFFQVKPESVSVWLGVLKMSQYEEMLMEAGYDDIDFICDMTLDDLHDIGIIQKGHVKRLLQGIGELTDLTKSRLEPHSAAQPVQLLSALNTQPLTTAPERILPPPDSWTDGDPGSSEKVDFGRMRGLLEMKMGAGHVSDSEVPAGTDGAEPTSPAPPQLPPKGSNQPKRGIYSRGGQSFSVEDITAALGEKGHESETEAGMQNEFDELNAALHGLTEQDHHVTAGTEPQPDQLLADIDDMLADLTTHLDFMIPGST